MNVKHIPTFFTARNPDPIAKLGSLFTLLSEGVPDESAIKILEQAGNSKGDFHLPLSGTSGAGFPPFVRLCGKKFNHEGKKIAKWALGQRKKSQIITD